MNINFYHTLANPSVFFFLLRSNFNRAVNMNFPLLSIDFGRGETTKKDHSIGTAQLGCIYFC